MLKLDGVTKIYRTGVFGGRELTAVRDVGFEVRAGQVVSLIGESGSGKSTIGRMILRLTPITGGTITLDGTDITAIEPRKAYYRQVQGVFQDPFSCFNPIFRADRVFSMIKEEYFPRLGAAEWRERVERALESVRLSPRDVLGKYPHQLSGGQLQRMLVARATLLDIRFLVADEIISMLDASTRIDVLNLLADLKARGLGILFITHDLSLGAYVSDWIVVLRRGRIVEMGRPDLVFGTPRHPYTRTLLAAIPRLDAKWADEEDVSGPCPYHEGPEERRTRAGLAEVVDGHYAACACAEESPSLVKGK